MIEWLDAPEENGWKSACGRFIIHRLPVTYRNGRFGGDIQVSHHPVYLHDNVKRWFRRNTVYYSVYAAQAEAAGRVKYQ